LSRTWLAKSGLLSPKIVFNVFKYAVYALLTYDGLLFFYGDIAASAQTFGAAVDWRNAIEAYAATFDTLSWIALLLLFELETAIIPDRWLRGWVKWLIKSLAGICYFIIFYSFYGYIYKYGVLTNLLPFNIGDVCSLLGSDYTWIRTLDEYQPFDQVACAIMNGQPLFQIAGTEIIGTQTAIIDAQRLAMVDVVNAADWLLIVALLEIEVFLQLKDKLTSTIMVAFKYAKILLYGLLFVLAAYWGVKSSFLDFWDAFLWLVAFIFIELNMFQWHEETEEEKEQEQASTVPAQ